MQFLLGPERAEKIKIFAGDVVPRKKPDPVTFFISFSEVTLRECPEYMDIIWFKFREVIFGG